MSINRKKKSSRYGGVDTYNWYFGVKRCKDIRGKIPVFWLMIGKREYMLLRNILRDEEQNDPLLIRDSDKIKILVIHLSDSPNEL